MGRAVPQQQPGAGLPLRLSLHCRFVSRILVVPDHPELLLSSSGVSVSFGCVHLRAPFSRGAVRRHRPARHEL